MQTKEITEVLNRPLSQELLARDLARLAYVAKDGTPRNVPIGFTWNGAEIVMSTAKIAPKLPALRNNPAVALTIDTEVHPPKILLIRGSRSPAGGRARPPMAAMRGRSVPPCPPLAGSQLRLVPNMAHEYDRSHAARRGRTGSARA